MQTGVELDNTVAATSVGTKTTKKFDSVFTAYLFVSFMSEPGLFRKCNRGLGMLDWTATDLLLLIDRPISEKLRKVLSGKIFEKWALSAQALDPECTSPCK